MSGPETLPVPKNESQLFKDIFKNYDPLVWPNQNNSLNWSIDIWMRINSLVDLNEKDQVLSLSAMFGLTWKEPLLKWDPKEYNTEVIYVPTDKLWLPDVIVQNAVSNYGQIGNMNLKVYLESTGTIIWFPGDFYKTYCKVDVRHYPFDTQYCKLILQPLSCKKKIVNLDLAPEPVLHMDYEENGEWELEEIVPQKVWQHRSRHFRVEFTLNIKRKTLFYIVNMILPIVFLSLLNSLVFALPANSGEKITLCISVMLSYAVFLTLVNDALPENSDGVCYFSAYLATEVFLSMVATIVTVVILAFHHRDQRYIRATRLLTYLLQDKKIKILADDIVKVKTTDQAPDTHEEGTGIKVVVGSDIAAMLDRLGLKVFTIVNIVASMFFFYAMRGLY
ncbi:acetylcholine receptor subunit alpha-like 2 [Haliotis rubra]|uniref:acetylcholine receptor subunit alpha-like 2 n=1 Tax=Haliotis rubra TaxID=36100 RepID=UPI001EE60304|nr:acetylcholine receptor subunit alpha-like 2 [Haliotis rubra]